MTRALSIALLGAQLCACGELPAPPRPEPEEFVPPEEEEEETPGVGVGEGQPPPTPVLDAVPESTGFLVVPVSGRTDPFAAVIVEGGDGTNFDDADSTGWFCINVALRYDETQTLSVFAQDSEGRASDSAQVTLTHDPALDPDPVDDNPVGEELVRSVVEPGVTQVYTNVLPDGGSLANLVDNDPSTLLEIDASRISLDLGAPFEVVEIEIDFPDEFGAGEDEYATEYSVLSSASNQSSVPSTWDELARIESPAGGLGDGGVELFTLEPSDSIRWLALELRSNAKGTDFFSEPFRIADVRVRARFTETPEPQPQPQAPRCAGGE